MKSEVFSSDQWSKNVRYCDWAARLYMWQLGQPVRSQLLIIGAWYRDKPASNNWNGRIGNWRIFWNWSNDVEQCVLILIILFIICYFNYSVNWPELRGWCVMVLACTRLVHLDVEDCSEELLRQQSYAIKNQLGHPKPPIRGYFACSSLVLYGIRVPIIGPFHAWKSANLMP